MRHSILWIAGVIAGSVAFYGCSAEGGGGESGSEDSVSPTVRETTKAKLITAETLAATDLGNITEEGLLDYGTKVFAENPTTLLEAAESHSYPLNGKAGGVVTINVNGQTCGAPDTMVFLFGPENASGDRGVDLIHNDDAGGACALDSKIAGFTLPVDGEYLIVVSSFQQAGGGHYSLTTSCDNGACALPGALTFKTSRLAQTDIDKGLFTPAALFDVGDFLFETVYKVEDGMGNALNGLPAGTNPRPNFRNPPVHFAAFGAPEAQSCLTCHNAGGDDGAGDKLHDIFQIGDGVNQSSGVQRNAPVVLGNGFRQQIGIEMTADLQSQLAAAKASAASTGAAVTKALSTKGISFGQLIAKPDGSVDTTGVVGVDADLVVKPFGWKGREATLRRFVEGGFRVHFGMQTSPSIAKNCAAPNPNTFGNGPDCHDPDGDGVIDEITEGQLSAMAVYMGLRETPVRVPAFSPTEQARAAAGEQLFNSVGCPTCHTTTMLLNNPVHVEPADTTGGAGITLHLATDNKSPHPAPNANGSITVELWSDFKRHDMGTALADSKPFNQISASQFITPPLWGVATSAPYLHDARAATLDDAILGHGGEALAVRNAYAALAVDDRAKIQEFLGTLGRTENIVPPPVCVNGTSSAQGLPRSIPDNNTTGITSAISVSGDGTVGSLALSLNITHPFRGDLKVTLISPTGTQFVVSNQEGGSADNIVITSQSITTFNGQIAAGTWQLKVQDLAAADVGTLNSWSLAIVGHCAPWAASATPNLATVDNGSACTSLSVADTGDAVLAKLNISGTHDFRSVLRGTLSHNGITKDAFPTGTFPSSSGIFSFSDRSVAGFTGSATGTWTLCIIDTDAFGDTGVLNTWSVHD